MTYTKRFYSIHSYNGMTRKLHPNRVAKKWVFIDLKTGRKVFALKYYRDTKALRRKHNFE